MAVGLDWFKRWHCCVGFKEREGGRQNFLFVDVNIWGTPYFDVEVLDCFTR